jgi:hypothetical protein
MSIAINQSINHSLKTRPAKLPPVQYRESIETERKRGYSKMSRCCRSSIEALRTMRAIISKMLVSLVKENSLGFANLLPERWNVKREGIEKGELVAVAPPLIVRIVFLIEIMLGMAAFLYLLVQSLQQSYIQSEVKGQLLPAPYTCTVLSPLNTMFGELQVEFYRVVPHPQL